MKSLLFLSIGMCFFFSGAWAQEKLVPLRANGALTAKDIEFKTRHLNRNADSIPYGNQYNVINLPFKDDFKKEGPYPDSSLWINNYAFVNRTYPVAPINYGVATLDGLNKHGYPYNFSAPANSAQACDTLTSKRINMLNIFPNAPGNNVYLSFFYQAQGRGDDPQTQDTLLLEFRSSTDSALLINWTEVWAIQGYAPTATDSDFHQVMIELDTLLGAKYLNKPWFQFRFRNYANPTGDLDHWNIDCVHLDQHRSAADTVIHEVAFVYDPLSFLANYQAMPWRQYQGMTDMAQTGHVYLRNNELTSKPVTYQYMGSHYGLPFSSPYLTGNDPVGLPPYLGHGYDAEAPVATPPVALNNFSFGNALTDTTVFEILHVNKLYNDTLVVKQNFFNYYAHDDGSAELGYGLEGVGTGAGGQLAVHFKTNISDTLRAVQFYWNPVLIDASTLGFKLCIWGPGGGQPGVMIYQSDSMFSPQYLPGYNHFRTYYLDQPMIISGDFYVGWKQFSELNMSVGFDQNTNSVSENFFKIDSTNFSTWQGSIFPGSLMIRPLFGDTIRMNGIQELTQLQGVNIYPNPAQDRITVSILSTAGLSDLYTLEILDLSGQLITRYPVTPGSVEDVSFLNNGFYLVRITAKNKASCVRKLLIAR